MLSDTDWSYLAGLFAGEGCFVIGQRKAEAVPHFELSIQMTDKAVVEDLVARWGGALSAGTISGSRIRQPWSWRIYDGYVIRDLVPQILPWMHGEKRFQGDAYLQFVHAKLGFYERRIVALRRSYTAPEQLKLYYLATTAREYAQGPIRTWRAAWIAKITKLEQQLGAERSLTIREQPWNLVT